uniref:Uncharacterized protein n=1 Tax=Phakopsora pachyrhizi TaxID=170000 RepID=A0A0S1MK00_PHAPC
MQSNICLNFWRSTYVTRQLFLGWIFLLLWINLSLKFCQAIPTVVLEGSCVGTIHVDSDSSNTLSLIRDVHQAFYTDNSHSQYHGIASRSFENVARELCMIVFGSPLWRVTTCLDMKDDEANSKCLKLAVDLNKRSEEEPVKIAATWNRGFNLILTTLENS